jgi:hypothetical protein
MLCIGVLFRGVMCINTNICSVNRPEGEDEDTEQKIINEGALSAAPTGSQG